MSGGLPGELEQDLKNQIQDLQHDNQLLTKSMKVLQEHQQQMQLFFDASRVGTWNWNLLSGEVAGDPQMHLLYGLDPQQSITMIDRYYELICEDDRDKVQVAVEEALAGRAPYAVEFRVVHADRSDHWIAARGSVSRDTSGKPIALLGINFDVDSLKKAEIAPQESERQFKTLADSIPQLAWMANPDGFIFWYSARWYEYTGSTPEQMQGWGWRSVQEPSMLAAVVENWSASIASGEPFSMEMPLRGKDASYRWFLTRATPVRNGQGEIVRWFGTNTDVTEIRQAGETLRASQNQLQQLADTMPQLVCVTAANGYVEWWNERWYSYSGLTTAESLGIGWTRVMHPDDLELTETAWNISLATGSLFQGEYRWRRYDGVYRWFLCRALPVRDEAGKIVRWFSSGTDIEDYKRADAEVRSLNEGLQERNEELLIQTHRAEEANRAKSSFLAVMSHEIRTPMNAILGMSDLLWNSSLDGEQRQYVEVFRRAGNNLLILINDILDLSKIEAGHFELEHAPFDIEDVADRSLELIGPRANAKKISLMCRLAPDLATSVIGDAARLQQVIVNLLGNAVKFTDRGEIVLQIRQHNSGRKGELDITVADTGIGIAPDKQDTIFQDFEQADSSITRRFGGTGLGLGICKRLVQRMGGNISVESVPGEGSTFRFTVKLEPGEKSDSAARTEPPDLHNRRILVIDNNATNRLILRETLTSWGVDSYECVSAEAGVDALLAAEAGGRPFAMVIIDRQMPGVDGFEAVMQVRGVAPRIPMVMLSSDDRLGDSSRRREIGLAGFALRPVKRADLLRLVCKALGTPLEGHAATTPLGMQEHQPNETDAQGLKLLIAEDSADNRMLFQAYLKRSPHTLTFAEDGKRAVDLVEADSYDVILMDIQMPVMDGLTATRTIRMIERAEGRRATPIIAITANASSHDAAASKGAGCDSHLSKPISKVTLLGALAHHKKAAAAGSSLQTISINVPEGLEDLIAPYLAARRKDFHVLQQALAAKEFNLIQKLGHDLKGTGTSFGFPELTQMGTVLETQAKEESTDALALQLDKLGDYLGRVRLPQQAEVSDR